MSDNNKSELEKNLKLLYDDIQIEYAIEKQKIDRAINKLNTIRPILILIETIICLFGSVIAGMILNNTDKILTSSVIILFSLYSLIF